MVPWNKLLRLIAPLYPTIGRPGRQPYLSLWRAVESIAPKFGCVAQTLLTWMKRREIDAVSRDGVTTAEIKRVKELERENQYLRRAD